jgi:hypothetical protein
MKSNRILQGVLIVLIIIFAAAAGYLYTQNNSEVKKHNDLVNTLNQKTATYNKGLQQEADLKATATQLASQLAIAQAALAQTHFRSSAESIEYDQELYNLAIAYKLQITNMIANSPANQIDQNTTYHVTTFKMTVEGVSPLGLFSAPADDRAYINQVIGNILALTKSITNNSDFDTAVISSVEYTVPPPLSDAQIADLHNKINDMVRKQISDQIDALPAKLKADNPTFTDAQLADLLTTTINKLIASTLAAETPDQLAVMVNKLAIARPSAVITIDIWTY